MRKATLTIALLTTAVYMTSCISIAPVHSSFEKAGTLGKGNIEASGSYSKYIVGIDSESEPINYNIGFRAGYGVSDKFDIKLRYENLLLNEKVPGVDFKASYFSVIPKVNFTPGKLALFVPLSMYRFKSVENGDSYKSTSYSIAPHLITTFTSKNHTADFSPSVNVEYLFDTEEDSEGNFLMGFNIGAGFSSDLRKWAIRPEVGYLFKPGDEGHIWNYGVALQFVLPTGKKAK